MGRRLRGFFLLAFLLIISVFVLDLESIQNDLFEIVHLDGFDHFQTVLVL